MARLEVGTNENKLVNADLLKSIYSLLPAVAAREKEMATSQ